MLPPTRIALPITHILLGGWTSIVPPLSLGGTTTAPNPLTDPTFYWGLINNKEASKFAKRNINIPAHSPGHTLRSAPCPHVPDEASPLGSQTGKASKISLNIFLRKKKIAPDTAPFLLPALNPRTREGNLRKKTKH